MAGFRDTQATLVVGLVAGSHVVNHMYYMLLPPITVALAADLGVGVARVGLAVGLLGAVVTGLQLPFGHLSDTRGRTPMLAVSLGFGAVGALLTATAESFAWLLLAQVVLGVGIAGHHPAHYPLLSAATAPDERGRAFSVHGFAGAIGFAAPPFVVAAASLLGLDWRAAVGSIAIVGAIYAIACLYAVRRYVDDAVTRPTRSASESAWTPRRVLALPRRGLRGLRGMLAARGIVLLTVLWFLTSMAAWGIKTQTLPLLVETYDLPEPTANALVSAMFVVAALTMLGGGWLVDLTSPTTVLAAGYVSLVGVTLVLASRVLPVLAVAVLTLALAATIDYSRPARATLADRLSESDNLGKNFGLVTVGISGGSAVAPPVLGVLAEATSVPVAFLAVAGLGLASLALLGVVVRVGDLAPTGAPRPTDD